MSFDKVLLETLLGSRQLALMRQFKEAQCHIVAVEESRHRQETLPQTADYVVVGHPAVKGHGGVQLWFGASFGFTSGSRPFKLSDLSIVDASAEWIICKVQHPRLRCVVIAAHAPHSAHGLEERDAFWFRISEHVLRSCQGWPILFLGDTNAHLGTTCSTSVKNCQAEEQNIAGSAFHHWLLRHDIWPPSTFTAHQRGDGGTFLHSDGHTWRRLDYVGVDASFHVTSATAFVAENVDIGIKKIDPSSLLPFEDFAPGPIPRTAPCSTTSA